jgi:hypothetical protein
MYNVTLSCFRATIVVVEYVFVALGIQHAKRMHHIVSCGVFACTIFFYLISFLEKKSY